MDVPGIPFEQMGKEGRERLFRRDGNPALFVSEKQERISRLDTEYLYSLCMVLSILHQLSPISIFILKLGESCLNPQ